MRGRSSPKQGGVMEVAKVDKLKQEPHLSGAYIRSLVKQLTSSRTKDPKDHDDSLENSTKLDDSLCSDTQLSPQPQQPPQIKKKQVRRRLHTSRPYQERLLNMAEARREIVTALKFHRAAMKEQQQQQQQETGPQSLQTWPQESSVEEQGKQKSRRNPRIYASNTMMNNNIPSYNMGNNFSNSTYPCLPPQYPYSCPVSSFGSSQLPSQDHLNFPLPNQTLGLNLNFHDFNNLDATPYCISNNNSIFSSSSPSSSSDEFHYVGLSQERVAPIVAQMVNIEDSRLHPSMDDQEMAEIRSIGEQHEMEWNDTLNLATSAWWFKFLKTMEVGPDEKNNIGEDDYGCYPFDEVMEFPAWFNPNESCLQQHVDDTYSDPTLPCMDIEEIEGMDAEWLA
ncbi:hypothetical protein RND71_039321 [Anisodus tanguticus]|uniref:Hydroxyproline-rich glycoprotein family protein n=1 Tax=Anisodus tanguticus TaxID=243964 RepID=A0AAE1QW81_9SOLA|nr:hypothetical protein RND71_039321 [Anisodus tanguticus]